MSRLIDADSFKRQIKESNTENIDEHRMRALLEWIDIQDTAFDVEKVFKQLIILQRQVESSINTIKSLLNQAESEEISDE